MGGSGASDLLYNLAGGGGIGGSEGSINFVVSDVLFLLDRRIRSSAVVQRYVYTLHCCKNVPSV